MAQAYASSKLVPRKTFSFFSKERKIFMKKKERVAPGATVVFVISVCFILESNNVRRALARRGVGQEEPETGEGHSPSAVWREFETRPPQNFFFLFERKKNFYEKERKGGPGGHCLCLFSVFLGSNSLRLSCQTGFSSFWGWLVHHAVRGVF